MSSRADFTEEEWARLGRAPLVAGMAISIADPGGPFETIKESTAALNTLLEAAREGGFGAFVHGLAQDVAAKAQRRESPMAGFAPDRREPRPAILDELRAVNRLLLAKATPEEASEYRAWIRTASQRAALAAKEGGFLGIGGQLVSEREQEMLDTLGEIFGAPHADAAHAADPAAATPVEEDDPETAALTTFDALFTALTQDRDADAAAALFADEGDVVMWGSDLDEQAVGRRAVTALHRAIASSPATLAFTWQVRQVRAEGDVAWVNAAGEVRVEREGAEPRTTPYRVTAVFVRRSGAWRWHTFSGSEPTVR